VMEHLLVALSLPWCIAGSSIPDHLKAPADQDLLFTRPIPSGNATPIWPHDVPGERPGAIGSQSTWCTFPDVPVSKCGNLNVGNITIPTITPYLVPGADSAMVIAPGGGYQFLATDREGTDIAAWLNSIGVSAFLLEYRVPGRDWLPFGAAALMDAQRAMGLVRQMSGVGDTVALNKSKVGFIGFSAGAHLSGHLNVEWQNRSYARVDAADDESCRPDFSIMVYPWRSVSQPPVNEPLSGASSLNVTNNTPPTMLVQTEDDPVHVENSLFYWLALKQHAVAAELHLYPRGNHGYGRCTVSGDPWNDVCTWPDRAVSFLRTLGVAPNGSIAVVI